MASSSSFASSSSSSSTSSSFPSSALVASRARRQRRNAISREAESEWDTTPASDDPAMAPPPPRRTDELICPLAPSSAPPSALPCLSPADEGDDIQAMLARFTFPSPTRKHRRSGETVDHSASTSDSLAITTGARGCETGPIRRALCAHCEPGHTNI